MPSPSRFVRAAAAAATATAVLALLDLVNAERATVEGAAVHTLDRMGVHELDLVVREGTTCWTSYVCTAVGVLTWP